MMDAGLKSSSPSWRNTRLPIGSSCVPYSTRRERSLQQWRCRKQAGEFIFSTPLSGALVSPSVTRIPGALGADRLAALIAAHDQFQGSTCIVDCGTAVTVDAFDQGGEPRGGTIFPGSRACRRLCWPIRSMDIVRMRRRLTIPANSNPDAIYTGCLSAVAVELIARSCHARTA